MHWKNYTWATNIKQIIHQIVISKSRISWDVQRYLLRKVYYFIFFWVNECITDNNSKHSYSAPYQTVLRVLYIIIYLTLNHPNM